MDELNWKDINNNIKKSTLSADELRAQRIWDAYREVRAASNVQNNLMKELRKVSDEVEKAIINLNKVLDEDPELLKGDRNESQS